MAPAGDRLLISCHDLRHSRSAYAALGTIGFQEARGATVRYVGRTTSEARSRAASSLPQRVMSTSESACGDADGRAAGR